jgi:hypothetical protein
MSFFAFLFQQTVNKCAMSRDNEECLILFTCLCPAIYIPQNRDLLIMDDKRVIALSAITTMHQMFSRYNAQNLWKLCPIQNFQTGTNTN